MLHVTGSQFQSRRTAIDNAAQRRAMAFAEAGYREEFSNCIARHSALAPVAKSPLL
jgi:hypothetical protein